MNAALEAASSFPQELRELKQWAAYRMKGNGSKPKPDKVPHRSATAFASSTDPRTWLPYQDAVGLNLDGVGLMLTAPYVGIDVDGCRDAKTGALSPFATWLVAKFDTYTEVSPSGTGIHLLMRGTKATTDCRFSTGGVGHVEVYSQARFLTLTGDLVDGRAALRDVGPVDMAAEIAAFETQADDALVERARAASNGNGEKFRQLFDRGDLDGYESASEADLALASILMFWTNGATEQADRLFRRSKLWRPKWDERRGTHTYGERTLSKAAAKQRIQELASQGEALEEDHSGAETLGAGRDTSRTDLGNARRLVRKHVGDILYVRSIPAWLLWDGRRWVPDEKGRVDRLAKGVVDDLVKQGRKLLASDPEEAEKWFKFAARSSTKASKNSMLDLASTEEEVAASPKEFDGDPWLLNVQNGTLDLRTAELRSHRREDRLMKLAPVVFNPSATCPQWEKFLSEVFANDPELIGYVQRALGYSLTGDAREECLFFCYGGGRNGKSTLLEVVLSVLGDYTRSASFDTIAQQQRRGSEASSDIARLRGARFVQVSEARGGRALDTELVKRLTGRDTITARALYKTEEEFQPEYKLWLRANHKPPVPEQTLAFWRRMRLIPFTVTFTKQEEDPELRTKLLPEAPGILNWLLAGCRAWQQQGLGEPPAVAEATEGYRADNDIIAEFFGDCCELDPEAWSSTAELFQRFEDWWQFTHGRSERVPGRSTFGRLLSERDDLQEQRETTGTKRRGWRGVRVNVTGGLL